MRHAASAKAYAESLGVTAAPMHPDWDLYLNAIFVAVTQSASVRRLLARDGDDMLQLRDLASSLVPNTAAQMTAAAALCKLWQNGDWDLVDQQGTEDALSQVVAIGLFDGVMSVLHFQHLVGCCIQLLIWRSQVAA